MASICHVRLVRVHPVKPGSNSRTGFLSRGNIHKGYSCIPDSRMIDNSTRHKPEEGHSEAENHGPKPNYWHGTIATVQMLAIQRMDEYVIIDDQSSRDPY